MDVADLQSALSIEMGSLYSLLTSDQVGQAIYNAVQELGIIWPLPESDQDRCIWVIRRAKRHATEMVCTAAAYSFDYKTAKLSNRFTQLLNLIKKWDADFESESATNPYIVAGNDTQVTDFFGQYRRQGYYQDIAGNDVTDVTDNDGNVVGFYGMKSS